MPKGTLILGDVGPIVLDDAQANREALDHLAPEDPVMLSAWTGHSSLSNSAAFKRLGVTEDEPNPIGGYFARSPATHVLTGGAFEFAQFRLERRLNELASGPEALQQTRDYISSAVQLGITSVLVMSMPTSPERLVEVFEEAPTSMRVRIMRFHLTDQHGRLSQEGQEIPRHPSALVTVSGTKWLLDGTPIEHSCAMRMPYVDKPDTRGQMDFSELDMEAMLRESLQAEDQLLLHVCGDRTAETFLKAMDATGGRSTWLARRVRIEHGDGIAPDMIRHAKDLGVIVVQNPTHFTRDLMIQRLGVRGADKFGPLRSFLNAGIPLAIGSDGPFNPYLNIMLATTYPGKPQEAITREQAVRWRGTSRPHWPSGMPLSGA